MLAFRRFQCMIMLLHLKHPLFVPLRFVSQSSNRITNVLMTCAFMHVVARLRAGVPLCMCLYVIVRFLADFALTII